MKVLTKRDIEDARNDAKRAVEVLKETRRKIFRAYGSGEARDSLDWGIRQLEWFSRDLGKIKTPENSRKLWRMEERGRKEDDARFATFGALLAWKEREAMRRTWHTRMTVRDGRGEG